MKRRPTSDVEAFVYVMLALSIIIIMLLPWAFR